MDIYMERMIKKNICFMTHIDLAQNHCETLSYVSRIVVDVRVLDHIDTYNVVFLPLAFIIFSNF